MGKNSFIIYYFQKLCPFLHYEKLVGYKYQLKPKRDTFMENKWITVDEPKK